MYNGEKSSDWKHLQFNVCMHVLMMFFFIKAKKHVFMFFICKSMFITSMICASVPPMRVAALPICIVKHKPSENIAYRKQNGLQMTL